MAIPRPHTGLRWLLRQPATFDILIAVFASVVGLSSVQSHAAQGRTWLSFVVALGTLGVVCFTLWKQALGLAAARKRDSTHELEGCLYTLHAVLAPPPGARLRLALHVPDGDDFVQVTDYVGSAPKPGRVGRRFPINAGIIGKAFLERDAFVAHRAHDDYEPFVQELIREWHYTEEWARRLNPGAMEWMALPIDDTERRRVQAVLFMDVTERGFFTREKQELALTGLGGMAVFIARRYR